MHPTDEGPEHKELLSRAQTERLARTKVAVAGLSVGASVVVDLVRMGFGVFHIADPDVIAAENVQIQRTATPSGVGTRKDEALIAVMKGIAPGVVVTPFSKGITEATVEPFLDGAEWVVDAIGVSAIRLKATLVTRALQKGATVVSCAVAGFGASVVVYRPGGPDFGTLIGLEDDLDDATLLDRYCRALFPDLPPHLRTPARLAAAEQRPIPYAIPGVEIGAGIVTTEILRHIVGLGEGPLAPTGIHIDPVRLRFVQFEASWTARPSHFVAPVGM